MKSLFSCKAVTGLIVIACGCIATLAFATDAAELLNTRLADIHSLQANFTQTITDRYGKRVSDSHGHLSLVRPGKFRWEIIQPDPELVITDGKTISVYEPDLQQLVIRSFSRNDSEAPALLLSRSDISSATHFAVTLVSKTPEVFRLVPKNKDSLFASFQMEFRAGALGRMSFVDHAGQTTVIVFQQERRNIPLPSSLFHFSPPKGTDVIHDASS